MHSPKNDFSPPRYKSSPASTASTASSLTLALLSLAVAVPQAAAAQADLDLGPVIERHEMIPMRDGNRLSAYLYFPPGSGPWPAVFEQRYASLRAAGTRRAAAKLAEAGYVVALVNFRGTHLSEGTWVGYRALGWGQLKDGYDTCEWLAKQPWCTGNVGTFGSSQGGYAQNFLAVTQPPHLKCQYMVDTGLSLFQEGYRIGGTTRPNRFLAMAANCRNPDDNRRLMEEWFRHPHYDDYWRQEDCSLHFDKMNVPCFTIGSWYDFMNQGSIASFLGRQHKGGPNSRSKQQLVIGPWLHGRLNKSNKVGDLTYPDNAIWPEHEHMIRWFDHWLKGKDNGVDRDPPVRYYVMGAADGTDAPGNVWREATDWPPGTKPTSFYLQPREHQLISQLSTAPPAANESSETYISNPLSPAQIPGTSFPGARDSRPFDRQDNVLKFDTFPLDEPMEWTGRVRAELYVSSTARDTDFIVRVSDVYPDGKSILICDYPWRARYREGFDHEALLDPGKVHLVAFDVGWISHIFNRGHEVRVTIASSGAPLYEPNPQTGGPMTIEFPANSVAAKNTIYHSRQYPSRIIAPTTLSFVDPVAKQTASIRRITEGMPKGTSSAVFAENAPLVYTNQLLPRDNSRKIVHSGDADRQVAFLLDRLDQTLRPQGSSLQRVLKLNFYMASNDVHNAVYNALAKAFPGESGPAVSLVVTSLQQNDALVALDAIALSHLGAEAAQMRRLGSAEYIAGGSLIYVSGQAEQGTSLVEATRKTLAKLETTLKHCNSSKFQVVQMKCFLPSIQSAEEVKREIGDFYSLYPTPPTSFVEWKSNSQQPIEIELIAWGGPANNDAKDPIEFISPPGMSASPVFTRVVRVNRGGTIFIGDLPSATIGTPEEQLQSSFDALGKLLAKTGSDFKHLAKATYYVTDDEISKAHNAIRPKYYDPARPPAASKAMILSTGHPGSRYVMDMIAVPTPQSPPSPHSPPSPPIPSTPSTSPPPGR